MMVPTILKIASNVKPIILNGSSINQNKKNAKNINIASGQQRTNKIHHKIKVINVLIPIEFLLSHQILNRYW